jgi:hypothetical protein
MGHIADRPVYRVMRRRDVWVVKQEQDSIVHGFEDLYRAIAFVRREACAAGRFPRPVDVRIEDIWMVAQFDHPLRRFSGLRG